MILLHQKQKKNQAVKKGAIVTAGLAAIAGQATMPPVPPPSSLVAPAPQESYGELFVSRGNDITNEKRAQLYARITEYESSAKHISASLRAKLDYARTIALDFNATYDKVSNAETELYIAFIAESKERSYLLALINEYREQPAEEWSDHMSSYEREALLNRVFSVLLNINATYAQIIAAQKDIISVISSTRVVSTEEQPYTRVQSTAAPTTTRTTVVVPNNERLYIRIPAHLSASDQDVSMNELTEFCNVMESLGFEVNGYRSTNKEDDTKPKFLFIAQITSAALICIGGIVTMCYELRKRIKRDKVKSAIQVSIQPGGILMVMEDGIKTLMPQYLAALAKTKDPKSLERAIEIMFSLYFKGVDVCVTSQASPETQAAFPIEYVKLLTESLKSVTPPG